MSFSVRSYSSFDTDEFIDLDTALADEELRSLGATPETRDYYNSNYRISFKSVDAKETERLRNTLVTPMTCSSYTPRSLLKSPTADSYYAESVALFKNLSNNDHIDLVSTDLQDYMDTCDIDGLLSRPATRPNSSSSYGHKKDSLTSSRLNSHNTKVQEYSTLLQKLSEPKNQHRALHPTQKELVESSLGHTNNGYTYTISSHQYKQSLTDNTNAHRPQSRTIESIIHKRRSVDSAAFKALHQNNVEPTWNEKSNVLPKRHSMLSIDEYEPPLSEPAKSKLPTRRIPSTINKYSTLPRRSSNIQQPDASNEAVKRRSSNFQRPADIDTSPQRRNSKLQQPAAAIDTSPKRRDSYLQQQQPAVTNTSLQRRNSNSQQQKQPDQRRWSSCIPDQSQKTVNTTEKAPPKEISHLQRRNSIIANQYVPSRQEPRKLSNRHSMIVPAPRRLSREDIYENVQSSSAARRNASFQQDEPSSNTDLQHSSVKVIRRHTISASDKRRASTEQQAVDKRASFYGDTNHIHADQIHQTYSQADNDHQLQNTHTSSTSSNRRSFIKTSSYEEFTDEPSRYRSTLRNSSVDNNQDQASFTRSRNTVLANSKHIAPRETRLSRMYNDLHAQSDIIDQDAYHRHRVFDLAPNQQDQESPRYRVNDAEQRHDQQPPATATQRSRHRALSVPSTQQRPVEKSCNTDKPSLMPVPVRYRMHSNNSLSKYASVPENAGLTSFSPPKDARYNSSTMYGYPKDFHVEPSRSTGGLSNSTASSSHSSDRYYDPPTPPTRAVVTHHHQSKRRSMPVFNTAQVIDEPICQTENRYSSYLTRIKNDDYEENLTSRRLFSPRRQRVVSEENENYQHRLEQHHNSRVEDTEDVISSARRLLSIVKERRNRAH